MEAQAAAAADAGAAADSELPTTSWSSTPAAAGTTAQNKRHTLSLVRALWCNGFPWGSVYCHQALLWHALCHTKQMAPPGAHMSAGPS
jgi:hypothetical protein